MKTEQAIRSFLTVKRRLSPRTMEQYQPALATLWMESLTLPSTPDPIRRALARTTSVWVELRWWNAYQVFFRWCAREYDESAYLVLMNRVEKPRPPEVEMKSLDPSELARVLAAAGVLRDRAVCSLALDVGVRASEFSRIRLMDIGQDTIYLFGKGKRQMRVPLSGETRHMLLTLAEENGLTKSQDLIIPISRFGIYRIVRRAMDRAGIAGPKRGPHCLRHSLGRNYIAHGGEPFALQRIMRHRNIATTRKYVALSIENVVAMHHQHSPLRTALQGAQGVLLHEQVDEILQNKAVEKEAKSAQQQPFQFP